MGYIISMITQDGEEVIAAIPENIPYPRYDTTITWFDYQRILRTFLERYAVELGDVSDEEENVTFIIYKTK